MWLQLCFLNLLQTSECDCSDPSWHRNCYDAKMCITTCWLVPACCLPPSTELHSTASCMRLSFLSSPRWCSYGLGACVRKREEYEECCILLGHWCWAETPALVECKASTVFFNICTSGNKEPPLPLITAVCTKCSAPVIWPQPKPHLKQGSVCGRANIDLTKRCQREQVRRNVSMAVGFFPFFFLRLPITFFIFNSYLNPPNLSESQKSGSKSQEPLRKGQTTQLHSILIFPWAFH